MVDLTIRVPKPLVCSRGVVGSAVCVTSWVEKVIFQLTAHSQLLYIQNPLQGFKRRTQQGCKTTKHLSFTLLHKFNSSFVHQDDKPEAVYS